MRVLHIESLPFYPFGHADNTPYDEKLFDAQRRVTSQTRPPDDRDDAHPGAHPLGGLQRINPGAAGHRAPGYGG